MFTHDDTNPSYKDLMTFWENLRSLYKELRHCSEDLLTYFQTSNNKN